MAMKNLHLETEKRKHIHSAYGAALHYNNADGLRLTKYEWDMDSRHGACLFTVGHGEFKNMARIDSF